MKSISNTNRYTGILRALLCIVVDYCAFILAEYSAICMRSFLLGEDKLLAINHWHFWIVFPCMMIICMQVKRLYSRIAQFWQIVEKIWHAVLYSTVLIVLEVYFSHMSTSYSRLFICLLASFSFAYLVLERYALRKIIARTSLFKFPVLVIGAGKTTVLLEQGFKNRNMGYEIIGLLDDGKPHPDLAKYPVLGGFMDAEKVIQETGVQHVFIAAPGADKELLAGLIGRIQPKVKRVSIIPGVMGIPMGGLSVESLFNERIMFFNVKNNLASWTNRIIKRVFDLVATICGGILISPILLYVAYKIRKDSPGPVIYDGPRIGQDGKEFKCYKFRSMYTNGDEILEKYLQEHPEKREEWEVYHKLDDDPRVTPIGKFIRKTSIDELPQLLNVILGDMSLVGPRPYLPREKADMGDAYDTIILAKPGITGYWQVSGRSDISFDDRLVLESWYVYNWSFWMDMELLVKTVLVVLKRDGAK